MCVWWICVSVSGVLSGGRVSVWLVSIFIVMLLVLNRIIGLNIGFMLVLMMSLCVCFFCIMGCMVKFCMLVLGCSLFMCVSIVV